MNPRVGQLDASQLDNELLDRVKSLLWDGLRHWSADLPDRYAAELLALLKLAFFKVTIWDRSSTYGGRLQGLQLVDSKTGRGMSRSKKIAYAVIVIGGNYLWTQLSDYLTAAAYDTGEISLVIRVRTIADRLEFISSAMSLFNFLVFLYNGQYSTLILRLLRVKWSPVSRKTSRLVNYEFQNRQLVWNALTEFLLFIMPFVDVNKVQRSLVSWFRPSQDASRENMSTLPDRQCAICDELLTVPSFGECGHMYCYVCLRIKLSEAQGKWNCLRCRRIIRTLKTF